MSKSLNHANRPPLDPALLNLHPEEVDFFRTLTGIADEEELKSHIISVQRKAYELFGYPCIRTFAFTKLKIAHVLGYNHALQLVKQRENAILLDMGCCFGNDARKAALDGWPAKNIIGCDLVPGFWDCGHELFKTTPETFPAAFIAGNIFDSALLDAEDWDPSTKAPTSATPPLKELQSLTPLRGKVSAIFAGSFFHLFSEEDQIQVSRRLASLLSPEKGSIIFGRQVGLHVKGHMTQWILKDGGDLYPDKYGMFCHSPESWRTMWMDIFGGVDGKGADRIKVDAELEEDLRNSYRELEGSRLFLLKWSVTRL